MERVTAYEADFEPDAKEAAEKAGHGGGDYFLYKDFIDYITVNSPSFTRTTINDSIECHLMGFKAEESRQKGGIPLTIE